MKKYHALATIAADINELIEENHDLRREVEQLRHYRQLYNELLFDSMKHNDIMFNQMLKVTMTPGVAELLSQEAKERAEHECKA